MPHDDARTLQPTPPAAAPATEPGSTPPGEEHRAAAYGVASGAVGEGSALEIEDIGEGSSDAGQEVWAGQGEDDRDDD